VNLNNPYAKELIEVANEKAALEKVSPVVSSTNFSTLSIESQLDAIIADRVRSDRLAVLSARYTELLNNYYHTEMTPPWE
jgi:F0F1-type ATP synthase delta subunit